MPFLDDDDDDDEVVSLVKRRGRRAVDEVSVKEVVDGS